MMSSYERRIKSWHLKAINEDDYFIKYIIEYLAFVVFIKLIPPRNENIDRNAIQALKADYEIKTKYLQLIQNDEELKGNWNKIKNKLNIKPLKNIKGTHERYGNLKYWNSHGNGSNKGKIVNLEDWDNMVEFWYLIRNNLFHGSKELNVKRDEFLVEYGYKTLNKFMDCVLEL